MSKRDLRERVVVTGMSVTTPLGNTVAENLNALLEGRTAISNWNSIPVENIYCKVGGDLGDYRPASHLSKLENHVPESRIVAAKRLIKKVPWSTGISVQLGLDAAADANYFHRPLPAEKVKAVIAGHNINLNYQFQNRSHFDEEPDFIDGMFALHYLDTGHAGCVTEALGILGGAHTVGAACASGNLALKCAIDEIRYHGTKMVFVVGAVFEYSPLDLHAMALMGAISFKNFNEKPGEASRPFDALREGFVPSHGGAALVLESLESALARGVPIYAEVLGAAATSDANHLPHPSQDGQVRAIRQVLQEAGVHLEEVDYVNAHATSTPAGDLTELRTLKEVFGEHAYSLKINAPKSLLGHTCWSSATVESVIAIAQMNKGMLHACANLTQCDPEADLDLIVGEPRAFQPTVILKNSFGFGGMNCVGLFRRYEGI